MRAKLLKAISVCYRLAIEAIEHLKTSELEEMMDKRKSEILKESGINSENYHICESLSKGIDTCELNNVGILTENEEITFKKYGSLSVGIDMRLTVARANGDHSVSVKPFDRRPCKVPVGIL